MNKTAKLLSWLALAAYAVSFALPAVSMDDGLGKEVLEGWRCALMCLVMSPAVFRSPLLFLPAFFTLANIVLLFAAGRLLCGKPAARFWRILTVCAAAFVWLPWFFPGLWGQFDVRRDELLIGYYAWAGAFALWAASLWMEIAPREFPIPVKFEKHS